MHEEEKRLAERIRHKINTLHIYCRLCKLTKNKRKAMKLARAWGVTPLYRVIYLKAEKAKRKERRRGYGFQETSTNKDSTMVDKELL